MARDKKSFLGFLRYLFLGEHYVERIRAKAYGVCPRCGNKSRARKKAILMVPQKEMTE